MPALWLVLEDNQDRIAAFWKAASLVPSEPDLRVWSSAVQMIADLPEHLSSASLLSLDHDLYKLNESDPDPGCGRDVANYLASQQPRCPVIIHSSNNDAAWGMHNELTFTGWKVTLIRHMDESDWIQMKWLPIAQHLTRI